METTTPAPTFSTPVETPVEKLIRETLTKAAKRSIVIPNMFGNDTVLGPNEYDMARDIAAALTAAGHICTHEKFTEYGQCAACGRDMIPDLRAMPDLTETEKVIIETMANAEPEPRPLTRQVGRVAFRRLNTLEIRRRALTGAMQSGRRPSNFDRAEHAALSFAIDHIRATYGNDPQ